MFFAKQRGQRGIILLGVMMALMLASGLYFISQGNRLVSQTARETTDAAILAQARDALLARAVRDENRPGSLPCPAPTSDGNAPGLPPCTSFIGWLPWRTLGIPDLRDSSGERLWYVLSPAFQDTGTIKRNNAATLTLDGTGETVALVIAPGQALPNQNRPSNNAADYLDNQNGNPVTSNADENDSYFSGPAGPQFNDRALSLTTTMLFSAVSKRLLGEIRYAFSAAGGVAPSADIDFDGLSDIGSEIGQFPYLNPTYKVIDSPTWSNRPWYQSLLDNGWFPLITYNRLTKSLSIDGQVLTLP